MTLTHSPTLVPFMTGIDVLVARTRGGISTSQSQDGIKRLERQPAT